MTSFRHIEFQQSFKRCRAKDMTWSSLHCASCHSLYIASSVILYMVTMGDVIVRWCTQLPFLRAAWAHVRPLEPRQACTRGLTPLTPGAGPVLA